MMNPNGNHSAARIERIESGDYVKVGYVPPFLVERVQRSIPDPEVPTFVGEDGERIENPTDPSYLMEIQTVEARRNSVAMLAAVMYGMTLCDENGTSIEPGDDWVRRIQWLLDDKFNPHKPVDFLPEPSDPITRKEAYEASYLLYHALGVGDMRLVSQMLGQPAEEYEKAMNQFRG